MEQMMANPVFLSPIQVRRHTYFRSNLSSNQASLYSLPPDCFVAARSGQLKFGALDPNVKDMVATKKPEGFVPTPEHTISLMLKKSDLKPGQRILEPSAGQGHIIDAIQKQAKGKKFLIDTVEPNTILQKALRDRGYPPVADDILTYNPGAIYDRIIMNPPYGNGVEILHTIHCFNLLKPGGILVAVLPENDFLPPKQPGWEKWVNPKTKREFNEDLQLLFQRSDVETVTVEKLPSGTFLKSDIPDPVETRLVVLKKKK
jgi:protein-L-isoaspartate O-methyltransferase